MYSVQREVMLMTAAVSARFERMIRAKHKQFSIPMYTNDTDSRSEASDIIARNKALLYGTRLSYAELCEKKNKQRAGNDLDWQAFAAMMKA